MKMNSIPLTLEEDEEFRKNYFPNRLFANPNTSIITVAPIFYLDSDYSTLINDLNSGRLKIPEGYNNEYVILRKQNDTQLVVYKKCMCRREGDSGYGYGIGTKDESWSYKWKVKLKKIISDKLKK